MAKLQFWGVGWGGGWWRSLHVHTCEMLRSCCVALAHMVHARWSLGASQEVPAEATCDQERTLCKCSNVSKICMVLVLATQQERPKPLVGHGKHVPKIQVTTKLRTSRSKNEELQTKRSCCWRMNSKRGCRCDALKIFTFYFFQFYNIHIASTLAEMMKYLRREQTNI